MIKIGIIKEYKIPNDFRAPLVPTQCKKINQSLNFDVRCQSSEIRCYTDQEYKNLGIQVVDDLQSCDVIFGIKEVPINKLLKNKTYFMFSHTIKKQPQNKRLLQTILKKNIRLVDYECLKKNNKRIIAFGKHAGIAGAYNTLIAYGIKNNSFILNRLSHFKNTKALYKFGSNLKYKKPFKILITGGGRVAKGATELLESFNIKKVNKSHFIKDKFDYPIFCQISSKDYINSKNGKKFSKNEYYLYPNNFESNFNIFKSSADILINTAYWDKRYPRLFEENEVDENFKIKVIGDISCDINGAIPLTKTASSIENPFFDYSIKSKEIVKAFSKKENITIMSIDNLPSELPRDSSKFFGEILRKEIIPLLKNDKEKILENATIAFNGKLTERYNYLTDYIS